MQPGEKIRLSSYSGEIERIVVRIGNGIVEVCQEKEYRRATKEGREPLVVGFPLSAVLEKVG